MLRLTNSIAAEFISTSSSQWARIAIPTIHCVYTRVCLPGWSNVYRPTGAYVLPQPRLSNDTIAMPRPTSILTLSQTRQRSAPSSSRRCCCCCDSHRQSRLETKTEVETTRVVSGLAAAFNELIHQTWRRTDNGTTEYTGKVRREGRVEGRQCPLLPIETCRGRALHGGNPSYRWHVYTACGPNLIDPPLKADDKRRNHCRRLYRQMVDTRQRYSIYGRTLLKLISMLRTLGIRSFDQPRGQADDGLCWNLEVTRH